MESDLGPDRGRAARRGRPPPAGLSAPGCFSLSRGSAALAGPSPPLAQLEPDPTTQTPAVRRARRVGARAVGIDERRAGRAQLPRSACQRGVRAWRTISGAIAARLAALAAAVAPTRAIRAARRGATWARGPSGSRNRAPGRAWVSSASAASSSIWSGHEARAHRPIFARERFRRRRRGRHAVRAIELVPAWARVASSSRARAASGSRVPRASAAFAHGERSRALAGVAEGRRARCAIRAVRRHHRVGARAGGTGAARTSHPARAFCAPARRSRMESDLGRTTTRGWPRSPVSCCSPARRGRRAHSLDSSRSRCRRVGGIEAPAHLASGSRVPRQWRRRRSRAGPYARYGRDLPAHPGARSPAPAYAWRRTPPTRLWAREQLRRASPGPAPHSRNSSRSSPGRVGARAAGSRSPLSGFAALAAARRADSCYRSRLSPPSRRAPRRNLLQVGRLRGAAVGFLVLGAAVPISHRCSPPRRAPDWASL